VQLLVDNRSDSTKVHGATIRFMGFKWLNKFLRTAKLLNVCKKKCTLNKIQTETFCHPLAYYPTEVFKMTD